MNINDIDKCVFDECLKSTGFYSSLNCDSFLDSISEYNIFYSILWADGDIEKGYIKLEDYLEFEKKYKLELRNKKIKSL